MCNQIMMELIHSINFCIKMDRRKSKDIINNKYQISTTQST